MREIANFDTIIKQQFLNASSSRFFKVSQGCYQANQPITSGYMDNLITNKSAAVSETSRKTLNTQYVEIPAPPNIRIF
jgi:hypothetical protein